MIKTLPEIIENSALVCRMGVLTLRMVKKATVGTDRALTIHKNLI